MEYARGISPSEVLEMIVFDIGDDISLKKKWEPIRSYIENGNLQDSEILLRKLLDENETAQIWNSLFLVYLLSGEEDDAKIALMNAQDLGPDELSTLNLWGDAFRLSQTPEIAMYPYQRAIALFPEHPRAYRMAGVCLYELERHRDATRFLKKAAARDPSDDLNWTLLGVTLTAEGKLNQAERLLKKYSKKYPNNYGIWFALGCVLANKNRWHKAEKCFLRADKINPGDPSIQVNLAAVYRATGRPDAAVRAHRRAIELNPDHFTSWMSYGSYMMEMNCEEEARNAFDRAFEISPESFQDMVGQVGDELRRHGLM
ncbi:MAG: tetratricopeptide repeat protein [Candidatus Thorarchaeota archaeon]